MKIRIHVTDKDIKLGTKMDCHACPIARAIERVIGVPSSAGYDYIGSRAASGMRFKPNNRTIEFMDNFDKGKKMKRTSFTLESK